MKKQSSFFAMSAIVLAVLFALSASAPLNAYSSKKTIKIKNTTTFNVDEIYIADPDDHKWGNDILDPDEVLQPGEVVEVTVECGVWDVKLVAQDKSVCEISSINLCASTQWNITANCR
ncbi:MAG: hypothetical protein ACOVSW_03500 [Candidatus Kapaibacteriota bacterium]|jgi:hypothetical protein